MTEVYEGGCQCGQVRYRLAGPLAPAYACHCRDCQRQTASAFAVAVPIALSDFTLTGETGTYEYVADSGARKTCVFCSGCGVRIHHLSSDAPGRASLKAGTLDDTSVLEPVAHLWTGSKQAWVRLDPGVPAHETQPPDLPGWRATLTRR
jgi:hypothetical protein